MWLESLKKWDQSCFVKDLKNDLWCEILLARPSGCWAAETKSSLCHGGFLPVGFDWLAVVWRMVRMAFLLKSTSSNAARQPGIVWRCQTWPARQSWERGRSQWQVFRCFATRVQLKRYQAQFSLCGFHAQPCRGGWRFAEERSQNTLGTRHFVTLPLQWKEPWCWMGGFLIAFGSGSVTSKSRVCCSAWGRSQSFAKGFSQRCSFSWPNDLPVAHSSMCCSALLKPLRTLFCRVYGCERLVVGDTFGLDFHTSSASCLGNQTALQAASPCICAQSNASSGQHCTGDLSCSDSASCGDTAQRRKSRADSTKSWILWEINPLNSHGLSTTSSHIWVCEDSAWECCLWCCDAARCCGRWGLCFGIDGQICLDLLWSLQVLHEVGGREGAGKQNQRRSGEEAGAKGKGSPDAKERRHARRRNSDILWCSICADWLPFRHFYNMHLAFTKTQRSFAFCMAVIFWRSFRESTDMHGRFAGECAMGCAPPILFGGTGFWSGPELDGDVILLFILRDHTLDSLHSTWEHFDDFDVCQEHGQFHLWTDRPEPRCCRDCRARLLWRKVGRDGGEVLPYSWVLNMLLRGPWWGRCCSRLVEELHVGVHLSKVRTFRRNHRRRVHGEQPESSNFRP